MSSAEITGCSTKTVMQEKSIWLVVLLFLRLTTDYCPANICMVSGVRTSRTVMKV